MKDNESFLLLLEKVSDISERCIRIETKMEAVEKDVEIIKNEDRIQNELLAEHIQGTIINTQRMELEIQQRKVLESKVGQSEDRISKLEETPKFLSKLKKVLVYIVTVGGAIMAILAWFK